MQSTIDNMFQSTPAHRQVTIDRWDGHDTILCHVIYSNTTCSSTTRFLAKIKAGGPLLAKNALAVARHSYVLFFCFRQFPFTLINSGG